jgi:hypothetical protein
MQFTLILATAAAAYPQVKSSVGKAPAFVVAFLPRPSLRKLQATNHNLADDQLTARQRRIRKHNEQSEGISPLSNSGLLEASNAEGVGDSTGRNPGFLKKKVNTVKAALRATTAQSVIDSKVQGVIDRPLATAGKVFGVAGAITAIAATGTLAAPVLGGLALAASLGDTAHQAHRSRDPDSSGVTKIDAAAGAVGNVVSAATFGVDGGALGQATSEVVVTGVQMATDAGIVAADAAQTRKLPSERALAREDAIRPVVDPATEPPDDVFTPFASNSQLLAAEVAGNSTVIL